MNGWSQPQGRCSGFGAVTFKGKGRGKVSIGVVNQLYIIPMKDYSNFLMEELKVN